MRYPILFSPEDDIIDICWDNVFKAIFTQDIPPSQGALKRLISAFIGRSVDVLAVVANEPPALGRGDRQIRYDIRVRFDQGELANVEMTLNPQGFEALRLEYYAARLYSSQDIQGADKTFGDLTHTYQIAIIGRKRLFGDEPPVHQFRYYDQENKVSLGGRTRIIVVELEKAAGLLGEPVSEMSPAERWTVFFRYVTDPQQRDVINKILTYEEGIAMAGEVLLSISKDEAERARLESEYKYRLDRQSEMVQARRDGLVEGELIGLKKGELIGLKKEEQHLFEERREIARKLLTMGLSPDQIARATGLAPGEIPL
ncbi:Rpn family recombination-promoting nuclease/putative transposase [Treponema sp. TIM-1]|uniref:Rpn family recombination-promoting nuclease/putative transposase n=1 Tax=Treponema sp. TIM-1 TaxID=2898417 RepID=UPI00397EC2CA